MKNKIITIMIALILVGTVIGAVVINNKTVKIDAARYDKAVELGIDIYDSEDYNNSDNWVQRCLISRSALVNLHCSEFYPNESYLDQWEEDYIWGDRGILQVEINRDNVIAPEKVGEGITTLSK